ncbi:S1 RNA binding domain-containing protein [Entamoeba marina]
MVELTTIDTPSLSKTLIDDECTTGYISKQLPNGYIISFNSFTFGLLPYTEIGSTLDEIEINKNEYHLGSSIKVIPHHNKEKVMLTLSKHSKPEVGDILAGVCGTYDYANQRLRVYLRGNQLVYLHVTDMCDVYHAFPLDTLTTGSMYNMAIIATTPTTYVSAYVDIFRPIVGGVISPLVTLETIHKDDVVMGYITSTDSSSGIDVTVGKDISVHVAVDDALDDNKYSADEFKKIFCLNRLVRLRINDVDEEQISGSLKQSVVYPGVVRFFKDAKVGMVVKCIVVGVTKDGDYVTLQ